MPPAPEPVPHDRPGTRRTIHTLGVPPLRLRDGLPPDSAHHVVAELVLDAARHLDDLHAEFREYALSAAQTLIRVADHKVTMINRLGVLQDRGPKIDILAARLHDAQDHLDRLMDAYQTLGPPPIATLEQQHAATTKSTAAQAKSRVRGAARTPGDPTARAATSPPTNASSRGR